MRARRAARLVALVALVAFAAAPRAHSPDHPPAAAAHGAGAGTELTSHPLCAPELPGPCAMCAARSGHRPGPALAGTRTLPGPSIREALFPSDSAAPRLPRRADPASPRAPPPFA